MSPPFYVLDGYKFCIKHKGGNTVCLLLLKGECDDKLHWPINLDYKLKVLFERPGSAAKHGCSYHQILEFCLSDPRMDLDRVELGCSNKEVAKITLPQKSLDMGKFIKVELIQVKVKTETNERSGSDGVSAYSAAIWKCRHCYSMVPLVSRFCPFCGINKDPYLKVAILLPVRLSLSSR